MDLILLVVLLCLSAFFSGSETAFFSLRSSQLARLQSQPSGAGRRVAALVGRAHSLLSALLIGNLVVNTATSVLATAVCLRFFGDRGLAVAVPAATLVLLLFGEITPKMLALRYRERLALFAQGPITLWVGVCRPLLAVISAGTTGLLRVLPWERTGTRPFTVAELATACEVAVQEGTLSETEGHLLTHLLQLQELEVRQIMTPRMEVVTLERDWPRASILATARRAGFNRYPVMIAHKTQPVGLFHLKDLLGNSVPDSPLQGPLRDLLFVPEGKDVAALLAEMRTGGTHLAAVVDEHGDFTGIVTMADCLQALIGRVGDVARRFDPEVFPIAPASWVVSGRLDLRQLWESCGVALPESRNYVTVAGFIMARLGRIPSPGDRVTVAGVRFTVLEMSGHKVLRLQVDRLEGTREEVPG